MTGLGVVEGSRDLACLREEGVGLDWWRETGGLVRLLVVLLADSNILDVWTDVEGFEPVFMLSTFFFSIATWACLSFNF